MKMTQGAETCIQFSTTSHYVSAEFRVWRRSTFTKCLYQNTQP